MSLSRGLRRTSAVVSLSSLALLAAGITAVTPAHAGGLDCFSGSITNSGECTAPGPEGVSQAYDVIVTGGGGGSPSYASELGGGGAIVTTSVSLVGGQTFDVWVGQGGVMSYGTASGGGSSAIKVGDQLLIEAGGGGGAAYANDGSGSWPGGNAGNPDGSGQTQDGDDWGTCDNDVTGGRGADGAGGGGAGGIGVCDDGGFDGQAGTSVTGTASTPGGNGASIGEEGERLPGGQGYSKGGDSGNTDDSVGPYYVGSGGGGGYGGGGGGATNEDGGENGPGGGGGSYTNPNFTTGTKFATALTGAGAGGDSSAGSNGEILLVASNSPKVQTQSAVPTVDATTTLTSMVNANGTDTDEIVIRYSQSPTMQSSSSATVSPTGATGSSDTTVTGTVTGLAAGTWYYQTIATNSAGTTFGAIETFIVGGNTEPLSVLSLPDQVVAGRQTPVTIRVTINGQPVDGTAKVYHAAARMQRLGSFVCEAQIVNGSGKCNGVFGLGKITLTSIFNGSGASGVVSNTDNAAMAAASIKAKKPQGRSVKLHGLTMKNRSTVLIYKATKRSTPAQLVATSKSNKAGKWASTVGYSNPATIYCAVVPQGESKSIKVTKSGYKVLGSANRSAARGDLVYC